MPPCALGSIPAPDHTLIKRGCAMGGLGNGSKMGCAHGALLAHQAVRAIVSTRGLLSGARLLKNSSPERMLGAGKWDFV